MVNKNKNHTQNIEVNQIASIVGTTAMLAATFCGLIEHMDHESHRLLTAIRPTYASVAQVINADVGSESQIRRAGREEIHHSSATYGTIKRTESVSGNA
jgi:hypothetical protein